MKAVQPCDFAASPVSSNILLLTQPSTCPPPLNQIVLLASKPNCGWCVPKQVSTKLYFLVFGSKTAASRALRSSGKSFADGCVDPALQKAGFSGPRTAAASHTRPVLSIIE